MLFYLKNNSYIDTEEAIDISISLSNTDENPRAWYVDLPNIEPVRAHGFLGSIAEGGNVNFRNILFNPHGHGTHTECLGHITPIVHSVNQSLKSYFFEAELVSIQPKTYWNEEYGVEDRVISRAQLDLALKGKNCEALVLRTLPNDPSKKSLNHTETNPPYLDAACVQVLNSCGVKHFLIDQPSVDREVDNGVLAFHHSFWQVPEDPQFDKTITEMIFVPKQVMDGRYILELQTAPFENDATPSRPLLYQIHSA